jgi:predicted transcriptional regulator
LAVIRALYEYADGLDEIKLASEARLGISEALGAAGKLINLGLVESVQENGGGPRYRLNRERLQTQVESAPDALLS